MNFTKINQVKDYIDNILSKSITFKLEEGHKISLSKKMIKDFILLKLMRIKIIQLIYIIIYMQKNAQKPEYISMNSQ